MVCERVVQAGANSQPEHTLAEVKTDTEEGHVTLQESDAAPPKVGDGHQHQQGVDTSRVGSDESRTQPGQARPRLPSKDIEAQNEQSDEDDGRQHEKLESRRVDSPRREDAGHGHDHQHDRDQPGQIPARRRLPSPAVQAQDQRGEPRHLHAHQGEQKRW